MVLWDSCTNLVYSLYSLRSEWQLTLHPLLLPSAWGCHGKEAGACLHLGAAGETSTEDLCLAARWMANPVCLPSPVVGMIHVAHAPILQMKKLSPGGPVQFALGWASAFLSKPVIFHHCFPRFENWHEKKTNSVSCSFWGGVESNHKINTLGGSWDTCAVLNCSVMSDFLRPHGP